MILSIYKTEPISKLDFKTWLWNLIGYNPNYYLNISAHNFKIRLNLRSRMFFLERWEEISRDEYFIRNNYAFTTQFKCTFTTFALLYRLLLFWLQICQSGEDTRRKYVSCNTSEILVNSTLYRISQWRFFMGRPRRLSLAGISETYMN